MKDFITCKSLLKLSKSFFWYRKPKSKEIKKKNNFNKKLNSFIKKK